MTCRALSVNRSNITSLLWPDARAREQLAQHLGPALVDLGALQAARSSIHIIDHDMRGLKPAHQTEGRLGTPGPGPPPDRALLPTWMADTRLTASRKDTDQACCAVPSARPIWSRVWMGCSRRSILRHRTLLLHDPASKPR